MGSSLFRLLKKQEKKNIQSVASISMTDKISLQTFTFKNGFD